MILGIGFSHNATACVVDSGTGRVLFCCSEERFTRRKNEWGIPGNVLNHVFEHVAPPDAITEVAVGESCRTLYGCAEFAALINLANYAARDACLRSKSRFLRLMAKEWLARAIGRRVPLRRLIQSRLEAFGLKAPLRFIEHHAAHAASAHYGSPFEEALVLTLDGEGDTLSGSCWRGEGAQLTCLDTLPERASIGLFCKSVTALLGFKVNQQEGQVLGLAAHGDPGRFQDAFSRVLYTEHRGGRLEITSKAAEHQLDLFSRRRVHFLRLLGMLPAVLAARDWRALLNAWLSSEFRRFYGDILGENLDTIDPATAADIAAGAQHVFEKTTLAVFRTFHERYPSKHVALAGGVFANVQLNQRILQSPGVACVHVHPGMGDEGLALGAALALAHRQRASKAVDSALTHVFLGPAPAGVEIERALRTAGVRWESCDDGELAERTAAALAEGRIVGVVRGGLEYGPRALGHRSILADPRRSSVCGMLNERLARAPMMPFAPAILDACFDEILDTEKTPGTELAARFMTMTLDVRPAWRARIPAVVHIDGTARPQRIAREDDALLYAIVSHFRRLTGIGCVLNTSFNRHDEPIVNTPGQALAVLKDGPMDYLVLGSCWVAASESGQARETAESPAASLMCGRG
jgi:carbamoyltransferase